MKLQEGVFAVKLYELEQQYGKLQSRLRLCMKDDHSKIQQELQKALDEYRENIILLQENVKGCRSPAVTAMAEVQLDYFQHAHEILEKELPKYLDSESSTTQENKTEATALYAEYAIDFAIQSMKYALIAALRAIDEQMNAEEKEKLR